MKNLYSLTVTDPDGVKLHTYSGREDSRTIGIFISVADERNDIESVVINMGDGTTAVFLPYE